MPFLLILSFIKLNRIKKPIAMFKTKPNPERKLITQKNIKKAMLKEKTPKRMSYIIYMVVTIKPAI